MLFLLLLSLFIMNQSYSKILTSSHPSTKYCDTSNPHFQTSMEADRRPSTMFLPMSVDAELPLGNTCAHILLANDDFGSIELSPQHQSVTLNQVIKPIPATLNDLGSVPWQHITFISILWTTRLVKTTHGMMPYLLTGLVA
jgi:hypothetical protein